jgi:hypothetical protein
LARHKLIRANAPPSELLKFLQNNNVPTTTVTWQAVALAPSLLKQNQERVATCTEMGAGYNWSCCDPFLLLVCELWKINIDVELTGAYAWCRAYEEYRHPDASIGVRFRASMGHFQHL